MQIIDSQVHIVGEDTPARPWDPNFGSAGGRAAASSRAHFTKGAALTDDRAMLAAMDATGVDAALLVATSHYGWDNGYSVEAARLAPHRFGVIGRVNHAIPDVEDQVAAWCAEPVALGLRILILSDAQRDQLLSGGFDRLLTTAQKLGLPVCICPWGYLSSVAFIADRYPHLSLVIDHLGLTQPPLMIPDPDPFQRLPELLELARRSNVSVKISAAPTLSRLGFPYPDLWPFMHRIIKAFSIERLMWGSDWTRVESLLTYSQGLRYLSETSELNEEDKALVLGGNLRRIFNWNP